MMSIRVLGWKLNATFLPFVGRYKFIDQPAFQHLSLTADQKKYLQTRIENLHHAYPPGTKASWIKEGVAPNYGVTSIDGSLLVKPPR